MKSQKMEKKLFVFVGLLLSLNVLFAQSTAIDSLDIDSAELSSTQKFTNQLKCQSIQSSTFYNDPSIY